MQLGLVGLGITLWGLSKSIWIMMVYALLISNVIYALRHRAVSQRWKHLQQQIGSAEQDRAELQRFRGLFQGMPHATHVRLPQAGHLAFVTHAEQVAQAARQFLTAPA